MRVNEYNLPKLPGVISMTKVKNQLKTHHTNIIPKLINIRVNGQLQGCSGFLIDPATNRIVYLSTDVNHGTVTEALYRIAAHDRDFSGGTNHFCDPGEIVTYAMTLLRPVTV